MRILAVEDDKVIGDGIKAALQLEGYAVDWVETVESAKLALLAHTYEMLLLDIGLPDGSGLSLLSDIRDRKDSIPILILTAYDDIGHKVKGLDGGADDYLIKPFRLEELLARMRALHRRREGRTHPMLSSGTLVLDPASKQVTQQGQPIILGPREFAVLQALMEEPAAVLSRHQLEDRLYGWGMEVESNAIEAHISKLRKKLGKAAIETIKYVGYRLAQP